MVRPICPLCPHRSQNPEMWVLWAIIGWHNLFTLGNRGQGIALRGSQMVSNNPQKIGQANGMPRLPTGLTQITKTGNVGSVDLSIAAHLFTIGSRLQANALTGS